MKTIFSYAAGLFQTSKAETVDTDNPNHFDVESARSHYQSARTGNFYMRLTLTLLLALFTSTTAFAQTDDAAKVAKAEEYFKLAKMDELMTQLMNQIIAQSKSGMMQQMTGAKLSPEEQQRVNDVTDKAVKIVSGAMSWDALEPEYAKLYAEAYTEQQLDDIIAFYKSPTGQAMVEKNPILIKKANAIAQQRIADVAPQLQKLMQDFRADEENRAAQRNQKQ
jgi:uncharacterized protein